MDEVLIIINDAPYGTEKAWNALRLAKALNTVKTKVNLFLLADGVSVAKKGQHTPTGFYNLEQMLRELIALGVEVRSCGTCCHARGLGEEDLIEGVEIGKMLDLAHWVKESSKVISF